MAFDQESPDDRRHDRRHRHQRLRDAQDDALLLPAGLLRDEARQRGTDYAIAERRERAGDHEQHERRREPDAEVADRKRDEARRDERRLAKTLHEPADQAALQDHSQKPAVAEHVSDLERAEWMALIREAPLG